MVVECFFVWFWNFEVQPQNRLFLTILTILPYYSISTLAEKWLFLSEFYCQIFAKKKSEIVVG